jgi:hypothetical protein
MKKFKRIFISIVVILFIINNFTAQDQIIKSLHLTLKNEEKFEFKSSSISKGNFQLKLTPKNFGKYFEISITNMSDKDYSIFFNKKSLKDYNQYTCILPEGKYQIEFKADNNLAELFIDEYVSLVESHQKSLCDDTDNRVPSNDVRIGRVMPVGCTAQLLSNGALAMSGHCVADNNGFNFNPNSIVEFNVPLSNPNGNTVPALPQDQYPINIGSITWEYSSDPEERCGRDWCLFTLNRNAITSLTAFEAQGDFLRPTDLNPSTSQNIIITGFGSVNPPSQLNQTQQTDDGENLGTQILDNGGRIISYRADTEGGNSGSPIQRVGNTQFSYGIHNNGGCLLPSGGCGSNQANSGISFAFNNLNNSLNNWYGNNTIHVDKISNSSTMTGSVFRPYDNFLQAFNQSSPVNSETIIIVRGTYDEIDNLILDKPMLILAPVGQVVIK